MPAPQRQQVTFFSYVSGLNYVDFLYKMELQLPICTIIGSNYQMIPRILALQLKNLADHYPVVTVIGPRQSGKSPLVKSLFPEKNHKLRNAG